MQLVSVVMPTFNSSKWVADTIDSVIGQTYPHVELIVVDDGSSDDTVAVVRDILQQKCRIPWKIIEHTANAGASAARNAGVRAATGTWVQFLDSDDFMADSKLAEQMAVCANAPADVAAVYSPWRRCYLDSDRRTWEGPIVEPDMANRPPIMCLVAVCRPLLAANLTRRSVLDEIGGFDESLRFWECEEINVRIARAGRIEPVASDAPLYIWRLHRGTIYIGQENARYRAGHVALSWINEVLKQTGGRPLRDIGLAAADRRHLLDDCTLWARLLYAQDRPAFSEYIARARRLDPDIVPSHPKFISLLARQVGYEQAEAAASLARLPKAAVRKALQRLKLRPENSLFDWN